MVTLGKYNNKVWSIHAHATFTIHKIHPSFLKLDFMYVSMYVVMKTHVTLMLPSQSTRVILAG
jgi:hypothetical protein